MLQAEKAKRDNGMYFAVRIQSPIEVAYERQAIECRAETEIGMCDISFKVPISASCRHHLWSTGARQYV